MLPTLPATAAVGYSRGLLMGGSGQQLVVQLAWLCFILCWTLTFTLPVCLVMRLLGVLPWTGVDACSPSVSFFSLMQEALRKSCSTLMSQVSSACLSKVHLVCSQHASELDHVCAFGTQDATSCVLAGSSTPGKQILKGMRQSIVSHSRSIQMHTRQLLWGDSPSAHGRFVTAITDGSSNVLQVRSHRGASDTLQVTANDSHIPSPL
jgi:hypothetical protein